VNVAVDRSIGVDDLVLPFQIDGLGVRGRLVRLGTAVDTVIRQHAYPEPVGRILAESLALASVLASTIKYDGVFSLQSKGNGPVRLLVADVTSAGDIRGYAAFDGEKLPVRDDALGRMGKLLGQGHMAFTVDQGPDTERFQGIVALDRETLADCARHYFIQSEQLDTDFSVAAGWTMNGPVRGWRAGAVMIQRLPAASLNADEDAWNRASHLLASVTAAELIDPQLSPDRLLYRLFHSEGVRVYADHELRAQCRCSRERAANALRLIPDPDLAEMWIDGKVVVTCQFCNVSHNFDASEVHAIRAPGHA
jgi:molecular chaperone Hsp33